MNIAESYIDALCESCECFRGAHRFVDRNRNKTSLYVAVGHNPVRLPPNYRPDRPMRSRAVAVGYEKARSSYLYVGYRIGRDVQTSEGRRLEQAIRAHLGSEFDNWSGPDDDSPPNFWPLFKEFHLGSSSRTVEDPMLKLICDSYCLLLEAVRTNFH